MKKTSTFQLLKSGTSFRKENIEKVSKLFDPVVAKQKAAKGSGMGEE